MKSILVIDTPKSCSECPLFDDVFEWHYVEKKTNSCVTGHSLYCNAMEHSVEIKKGEQCNRHPQCPLRQLPSKEEIKHSFYTRFLFR